MVFPWLEVNRGTFHPFSDPDLLGAQGAVAPQAIPLIPSLRREVAAVWAACGEKAWGDGATSGKGWLSSLLGLYHIYIYIGIIPYIYIYHILSHIYISDYIGCIWFYIYRILCMGSSLLTIIYKWETGWVKSARLAGFR